MKDNDKDKDKDKKRESCVRELSTVLIGVLFEAKTPHISAVVGKRLREL